MVDVCFYIFRLFSEDCSQESLVRKWTHIPLLWQTLLFAMARLWSWHVFFSRFFLFLFLFFLFLFLSFQPPFSLSISLLLLLYLLHTPFFPVQPFSKYHCKSHRRKKEELNILKNIWVHGIQCGILESSIWWTHSFIRMFQTPSLSHLPSRLSLILFFSHPLLLPFLQFSIWDTRTRTPSPSCHFWERDTRWSRSWHSHLFLSQFFFFFFSAPSLP